MTHAEMQECFRRIHSHIDAIEEGLLSASKATIMVCCTCTGYECLGAGPHDSSGACTSLAPAGSTICAMCQPEP